jgi:hypothetical protein
MTGVVPGFGTGARVFMSGEIPAGGRMTPSLRCSLSLKDSPEPEVAVDPVVQGCEPGGQVGSGSIFSGIVELFCGAGRTGGCVD